MQNHTVVLLCLLALGSVLCQEAEPTAAIDPAVAAELLPNLESVQASEAAAFIPLSEVAKVQLVDNIMAGVKASKDEVKQALANPSAAFQQYAARWATGKVSTASVAAPGGATDTKTLLQRKRIFMANLRKYHRLNAQDPNMAHGITPFTHLTQAEFEATMLPYDFKKQFSTLGASPTTAARSPGRKLKACGDAIFDNPYASGTLPTGVNWVTANMTTPIRNQGQCGSCAAFATTALAEFSYIKKRNLSPSQRLAVNFSEQDLLSCAPGNQCSGAPIDVYFRQIMCAGGMATETADAYKAVDTDACKSPITRYNVGMSGYAWVDAYNSTLLSLAVAKAPTLIAVDATSWGGYMTGYMGTNCEAPTNINHAVAVVGYINGVVVNGVKMDVYIIRNSWGLAWGGSNTSLYKGYTFVRKDCDGDGAFSMYAWPHIVPIV